MPELPEVETIRRELQAVLPGRRITAVEIRLAKMLHGTRQQLMRYVVGAKIQAVERRAKVLMISLSTGWTIVIHLKMSGQLIWQPAHGKLRVGGHPIPGGIIDLPNKYSHIIFQVTKGTLYFNDQRQFGYVKIFSVAELATWLTRQGFGPEPLHDRFTFGQFNEILNRNKRKRIKPTLMDQTVLAGVGNIYADEACWRARIRPSRRIATITSKERTDLFRGLRAVLELSLRKKGTTADAYRTATGDKGSMMPFLNVYGRDGKPCKRCRHSITKTVLAGRGTHYCPECQK